MAPATVTDDVAVLAVALGLLALTVLAVHLAVETRRLLQPARPLLPEEDRPPAGLGRLVPVGSQLEQECRQGLIALELWLVRHRRHAQDAGPAVPGQREGDRHAWQEPRRRGG